MLKIVKSFTNTYVVGQRNNREIIFALEVFIKIVCQDSMCILNDIYLLFMKNIISNKLLKLYAHIDLCRANLGVN